MSRTNTRIVNLTKKTTLADGDVVPFGPASGDPAKGIIKEDLFAQIGAELSGESQVINNRRVINETSDWPAALTALTEYYIGSDTVEFPDGLALAPNIAFTGATAASTLTYNGTGSLLEGGDLGIISVRGLTFDMPNGGQLFDITDTVPGSTTVNIGDYRILQGGKFGTVEDVFAVVSTQGQMLDIDDGLTVNGNVAVISIVETVMISTSATFKGVDLGVSVSPTIEVRNLLCIAPTGAVGISGAADSANLPAGSIAGVSSCEFLGGMDALAVITKDDFRWRFTANSGIADTNPDALLSFSGNALVTTIVTQNVGVQVNAVWTVGGESHFEGSSDGSVTYLGERPISVPIGVDVGLLADSGNFDAYMQIAINGAPIASGVAVSLSASKPTFARVQFQHTFLNGEILTVLAVNKDGTANVVVESATNMIR